MPMKFIVVGSEGSIGKKRKTILEEMGHKVIGIDPKSQTYLHPELMKDVDGVFICTPPSQSVVTAMLCVEEKTPFFLEKPGAVNHREFLNIVAKCDKLDLVNMVACNMRFTNEYAAITASLPNIGKPVFVYAEFGYYLPFWREGEYKSYYSCYRMAGGGILMDAIHELDYIFSIFGYPDKVKACVVTHENTKEMPDLEAEDTANVVIVYRSGLTLVIHLDYLQRAYSRKFHAIGTKGRIDQTFNVQGSSAMYKAEMSHFIDCIKTGKETIKPVWKHSKILEFIDKCRDPKNREEI